MFISPELKQEIFTPVLQYVELERRFLTARLGEAAVARAIEEEETSRRALRALKPTEEALYRQQIIAVVAANGLEATANSFTAKFQDARSELLGKVINRFGDIDGYQLSALESVEMALAKWNSDTQTRTLLGIEDTVTGGEVYKQHTFYNVEAWVGQQARIQTLPIKQSDIATLQSASSKLQTINEQLVGEA